MVFLTQGDQLNKLAKNTILPAIIKNRPILDSTPESNIKPNLTSPNLIRTTQTKTSMVRSIIIELKLVPKSFLAHAEYTALLNNSPTLKGIKKFATYPIDKDAN